MNRHLMVVLAICLGASSVASAGEQSGILHRASCTLVRFYVAKYSAAAAEQWARSNGATDAEIETARRCLTPETTRTAKTQTMPVALGSYGF
jgi:conjugal transfer/entry exclusion protein